MRHDDNGAEVREIGGVKFRRLRAADMVKLGDRLMELHAGRIRQNAVAAGLDAQAVFKVTNEAAQLSPKLNEIIAWICTIGGTVETINLALERERASGEKVPDDVDGIGIPFAELLSFALWLAHLAPTHEASKGSEPGPLARAPSQTSTETATSSA